MSIVCTPRRKPAARLVTLVTLLSILLTACQSGSDSADETATSYSGPTVPTVIQMQATPTAAVTAEPTHSAALDALLAPGPTSPPPDGVFFQFGDAIWYQPGAEPARPVVEGQRIGPWAQTSDGSRIALVRYRDENGQGVEELVLVNNDGSSGDPVYGPTSITGAGGGPTITALDWSWDGQSLALIRSDDTIWTMRFDPNDPFRTKPPLEPVSLPGSGAPVALAWAPSGAGLAYTIAGESGTALYVTASGDPARTVIAPGGSPSRGVRTFDWLPGRGRLVFVEVAGSQASHLPGSIFTIAPDGTLLELLVSAGQFAPAATISTLNAAPDGRFLAFTVQVPDGLGQLTFQSLWLLTIDSGELRQVPIEAGYRVVDLAWSAGGLIWRGIDRNARVPTDGRAYSGDEPFILGRFDPASGATSVVFQSTLVE
ncbi:MAG TPA: hypothetical protein VFV93_03980 [Thermomicrobiales bacterium]|nr:hypothetical protein [Thermomicrobiales bacterium]